MARKSSRSTPRPPVAPPPTGRTVPRRPTGSAAGSPTVVAAASRSATDYSTELVHVRRDLMRIAVIAVFMFGIILAAPHLLK